MVVRGYTERELSVAVRVEKVNLVRERLELTHKMRADAERLAAIDKRLAELKTAENLLDGGLD